MVIIDTSTVSFHIVFITCFSLLSLNVVRQIIYNPSKKITLAPAIFVNHGEGPLPLLGGKDDIGLTNFLRDDVKNHLHLNETKGIILVTSHWEQSKVALSSSKHHDLYFAYHGFPPEAYNYTYDAPGDPKLANRLQKVLDIYNIESKLDTIKGWDPGVFVPMMLINPSADIPIVQMSIICHEYPEQHYKLGEVLQTFRKDGIAIIGSGMSYYNKADFTYDRDKGEVVNEEFDNFLLKVCTEGNEARKEGLLSWRQQNGAMKAHPMYLAEHFMPLIVVAGAGGSKPGERIFNWDMNYTFRLSSFIWKDL